MMRERVRSTPNRSHAQLSRFRSGNLVNASLSVLGRTFRTTIREGASAEELIERVARENGGGVAKVYYPEFKTWEIVAVKIGDRLLVKGDSKRVAEADFSQFRDGESVRSAAIAASKSSDGGIHFSLGESGIPMAATEEQGVVFPNAEELRIGKNINDIALWTTSAAFDPKNMDDIDSIYRHKGGASITSEAFEQISEAHGGMRSEKLMLYDNILVLDKDTGEVRTVTEHASRDIHFMDVPLPPLFTPGPQTVSTNIRQDMAVFDGRPERVSYLLVKTFDGAFTEHVDVGFSSLISTERGELHIQKPETASAQPSFSLLVLDDPPHIQKPQGTIIKPEKTKPKRSVPKSRNRTPVYKPPTFASALASWSMPRTEHICLSAPKSVVSLIPKTSGKEVKMPAVQLPSKVQRPPVAKPGSSRKKPKPKSGAITKKKRKKPKTLTSRKNKPKRIPKKKAKAKKRSKPKAIRRTIKKAVAKRKPAPEGLMDRPERKKAAKRRKTRLRKPARDSKKKDFKKS